MKGFTKILSSNLIIASLSIVRNIVVAQELGVEQFGKYAILILFYSYFGLLDLGINNGGLYALTRNNSLENTNSKFQGSIIFAIVYAVFFGFLIFKLMGLENNYVLIILTIPIVIINNYCIVIMRVVEDFKNLAISGIMSTLISTILLIWLKIYSEITIINALIINLIIPLLSILYLVIFAGKHLKFKVKFERKAFYIFFLSGFVTTIVPSVSTLYIGLDRFLLNNHLNSEVFSAFAFGCSLGMIGLIIPNSIITVVFRSFFGKLIMRDWYIYNTLNIVILSFGSFLYSVISGPIIEMYFLDYKNHIYYIDIGVYSIIAIGFSQIAISFLLTKREKIALKTGLMWLCLKFIILNFLLFIGKKEEMMNVSVIINILYSFSLITISHIIYRFAAKEQFEYKI